MFRIILLCAAWSTAATIAAEMPTGEPREWTDASGARRARAALISIQGDTLTLRKIDGKLATTTISALSEQDRQYVALRRSHNATRSTTPTVSSTVVETVAVAAEVIKQLPQRLERSQLNTDRTLIPAAIVYVRVSDDFLEDYVERSVNRRKQVQDNILGARITGESDTRGKTRLTLIPSNNQLLAAIAFDGTVCARTRGYKGPVVLHSISDSTFHASKLIGLDDSGLQVAPSSVKASTRLRTTNISTSLPRLRGRIATRIAWRRVSQSHDQAEAITSDHTADDIRTDFDTRTNRSLANIQKVLGAKMTELESGRSSMPMDVRYRCRKDCVEMALLREDATAEERKLRPPPALQDSDISVRVHRTLFTSAVEDPQLVQNLAPLLAKLLEARTRQGDKSERSPNGGTQNADTKWAVDLDWVSLDFKDTNR